MSGSSLLKPASDPDTRQSVCPPPKPVNPLPGLLLLLGMLLSGSLLAQPAAIELPEPGPAGEAWLVTYGPGEIYWQRIGHNAIWIRDPALGIDHTFNFGFFDFEQERFLQNFIQGRMLYFSVAQPVENEFGQYMAENRDISIQILQLSVSEYALLRDHLLKEVQPQNRDYLYDYYLANCSTKVRDALDIALEGNFAGHFMGLDATLNFRDHTRRSVAMDFWYYLGLELSLGLPVDRNITAWDEMFLPAKVSEAVASFNTSHGPLAGPEQFLFRSENPPVAAQPPPVWWRYLGAGLGLMLFFALMSKRAGPVMAEGSALAWLMITGPAGGLLLYLWLGTDHAAAGPNFNLLLLNPLFILGLIPQLRRAVAWLMLSGLFLSAAQLLLPVHQFNLDVMAFFAPLHLVCAWWLLGRMPDFKPWFSR